MVVDSGAFDDDTAPDAVLREVASRFPSVGTVFLARPGVSPLVLLRLGRAGIPGLQVLRSSEVASGLAASLARACAHGTRARVLRGLGTGLDAWARDFIGTALEAALLGWDTDQLSAHVGWSRPHLGVRLRERGLPPPGRILLWARMLPCRAMDSRARADGGERVPAARLRERRDLPARSEVDARLHAHGAGRGGRLPRRAVDLP